MVSACFFGVLLFSPDSPASLLSFTLRNILMGIAIFSVIVVSFMPEVRGRELATVSSHRQKETVA